MSSLLLKNVIVPLNVFQEVVYMVFILSCTPLGVFLADSVFSNFLWSGRNSYGDLNGCSQAWTLCSSVCEYVIHFRTMLIILWCAGCKGRSKMYFFRAMIIGSSKFPPTKYYSLNLTYKQCLRFTFLLIWGSRKGRVVANVKFRHLYVQKMHTWNRCGFNI